MAVTDDVALKTLAFMFLVLATVLDVGEATWCVVRGDASDQALQAALDYACGAGADCAPIQANGLCYLPNTVQAHAAYAFNSYYQRSGNVPYSCSFAGTATIARTDPSYGSCTYPSSPLYISTQEERLVKGKSTPLVQRQKAWVQVATSEPTSPRASTPLPESHMPNSASILTVKMPFLHLLFLFVFVLIFQNRCL